MPALDTKTAQCARKDLQCTAHCAVSRAMSYHYDATMTKSRMEMSNLGCALLEQMNLTDLNAELALVEKTIADKEDFLKHYRSKAAALRRKIKATTARKAGHEAAILG